MVYSTVYIKETRSLNEGVIRLYVFITVARLTAIHPLGFHSGMRSVEAGTVAWKPPLSKHAEQMRRYRERLKQNYCRYANYRRKQSEYDKKYRAKRKGAFLNN